MSMQRPSRLVPVIFWIRSAMKKRLHKRSKLKLAAAATLCYAVLHFTRLIDYFHQKNYFTDFSYPSQVNLSRLIGQLRANVAPEVPPSNPFAYQLLLNCPSKCAADRLVHVLLVVKSAAGNLPNRMAIRRTWGSESRTSGVVLRRIFLLAAPPPADAAEQERVRAEHALHGDLVQGDFADRYHNNTWKTIMGLKWVRDHCAQASFIFFVDDDFYVSPKNLLRLLDNPRTYPREEGRPEPEASERHWYTGHLFFVLPVRFTFHRFFVSLEEYPYNVFPPFVNAGAFLVSRHSLLEFYYASMYTSPLKLDDVYIGILAKKVGVQPTHNRYFFPYKVTSSESTYADLIASHGYRDPEELMRVWQQQVTYGNA